MKFARGLLIFSYGLFSIAAQTLLFREFVTTFEGNDISVGIFFGSWFLWVGAGAVLVRKAQAIAQKMLKWIEFLFLAYVPAFVLQAILITQARELAGIESYALWSMRDILLVSVIVNAPISLVTGMLFPIACRWIGSDTVGNGDRLPVSHVYIIEAAGSFTGGIGVTILLGFGVSSATIFLLLAFILSLSAFLVQLARLFISDAQRSSGLTGRLFTCALSFLVPLVVCLCLVRGYDETLMSRMRAIKWTKLLPKEALTGSFQTAQAEYLYGTYQGQWVAILSAPGWAFAADCCNCRRLKKSFGHTATASMCGGSTISSLWSIKLPMSGSNRTLSMFALCCLTSRNHSISSSSICRMQPVRFLTGITRSNSIAKSGILWCLMVYWPSGQQVVRTLWAPSLSISAPRRN